MLIRKSKHLSKNRLKAGWIGLKCLFEQSERQTFVFSVAFLKAWKVLMYLRSTHVKHFAFSTDERTTALVLVRIDG